MKILTVLTGGTISCSESDGVLSPDSGNGKYLLDAAARAGVRAEFVTTQPYLVLSENLGAEHLKALRACILSRLGEGFDGIIVTHKFHATNTCSDTAHNTDIRLVETYSLTITAGKYQFVMAIGKHYVYYLIILLNVDSPYALTAYS